MKRWTITDAHGTRTVTLDQFRAEIERRKALAAPIMEAFRRGDLEACSKAQEAMRDGCNDDA